MVDLDELKSKFLNTEFASRDLQIDADNLLASATASGEARAEFIDPAHPDFQATPAYLCSISSGRHLPIDFPSLGGIPMDCLLYTSPSPRDKRQSRMPSSA